MKILEKFKQEGILFNILEDEGFTIVTNKRVVTTNLDGDVLEEIVNDDIFAFDEDVQNLLDKINFKEED